MNTPRVVTDAQQRVVWRWENQEPFGNNPPEENPSGLGNFEFPLRFPGTYADRETGTLYNWHRDLDPATGRYTTSDPIGLRGGINPYLYVRANPLQYRDPSGLYLPGIHRQWAASELSQYNYPADFVRDVSDYTAGSDSYPTFAESQAVHNAPWHGLTPPWLTKDQAQDLAARFIERQIRNCDRQGLGRAIHTAQDITAAGHGFSTYAGLGSVSASHAYADWKPSAEAEAAARRATRDVIDRFQRNCGCM